MTGRILPLAYSICLMWFVSCRKSDDTRYLLVPASESGIDFSNDLEQTSSFNIFEYIYFYNGAGVAAGDLNGDGLDDLFFTANMKPNKLYINRGNFKFEDISSTVFQSEKGKSWTNGVTFADVNGDGKLDVYVSQVSNFHGFTGKNQLFINYGNDDSGLPILKEEAGKYGLDIKGFCTQAVFFDYDGDDDMDVFILKHNDFNTSRPVKAETRNIPSELSGDMLLRNDGNFFVDVTKESGIYSGNIGYGLGLSASDINMDGYIDIYVGNDFHEDDYLYLNQGDGTFKESLSEMIGHTSRFSMGNDIGDINKDGLPDIITLDMFPEDPFIRKASMVEDPYPVVMAKLKLGYSPQYARNTLQVNQGNNKFSDMALQSGVATTDWSWSVLIDDYDLNGDNEIYITNGIYKRSNDLDYFKYISNNQIRNYLGGVDKLESVTSIMPSIPLANYMYHANGKMSFKDVASNWGLDQKGFSNGAVYTDLDNDGDLDLVTNNINEQAYLYENRTRAEGIEGEMPNYIKVKFKGKSANTLGIGAKVWVKTVENLQYKELKLVRGYLSSVPPYLLFGLGTSTKVESLKVEWPDGFTQEILDVEANSTYTLDYVDSKKNKETIREARPFFEVVDHGMEFTHKEDHTIDFDRQSLLPHTLSTEGPHIGVSDVNGDGLDDFYISGAAGQAGALYMQGVDGFNLSVQDAFDKDKPFEDVGMAFFDVDGDKDQDLVVSSGGNNLNGFNHPRLYINDGKGHFERSTQFPKIEQMGSVIAPSDVDGDGDIDIFLGTRASTETYGIPTDSYLLLNDGKGGFQISDTPAMQGLGFIKDAVWADLDNDGSKDLILAREWAPITILLNNNGVLTTMDFSKSGLDSSYGWWNKIICEDFDKDGDLDLVVGNMGLNSKFKVSPEQPLEMYVGDFDEDGKREQLLTEYLGGKRYFVATTDELFGQMVKLKKKYLSYTAFAKAEIPEIFDQAQLDKAVHYKTQELRSSYFENKGDGSFNMVPLPLETQSSMVNTILARDFDGDGNLDLLLAGNFDGMNVQLGQFDASHGNLLLGDGKGHFIVVPSNESGLILEGSVMDFEPITYGKDKAILVGINDKPPVLLKCKI